MGNVNSGRDVWVWTPDREATLRQLWADRDLSASVIGEKLGVSRCAVLGKVARLGLPKRNATQVQRKPIKKGSHHPTGTRKPKPAPLQRAAEARLPPLPKRPIPTGKAWEPLLGTVPRPLIDLRDGMCKWPVSENSPFLFCGAPSVDGKSYCQHHLNWSVGEGTNFERSAIKSARAATAQERTYGHQSLMPVL